MKKQTVACFTRRFFSAIRLFKNLLLSEFLGKLVEYFVINPLISESD